MEEVCVDLYMYNKRNNQSGDGGLLSGLSIVDIYQKQKKKDISCHREIGSGHLQMMMGKFERKKK